MAREAREKSAAAAQQDSTLTTLGGRSAAISEAPLGDRDSRRARFPGYHTGPAAISPKKLLEDGTEIEQHESSWQRAQRGETPVVEEEDEDLWMGYFGEKN